MYEEEPDDEDLLAYEAARLSRTLRARYAIDSEPPRSPGAPTPPVGSDGPAAAP